jgi:hypothetical protein
MITRRLGTGVLFLLLATAAWAADVTGTWKGEVSSPDGNSFSLTYTFKQDGAKLTGTVLSPQGDDRLPLDNGKVEGDKISFSVKGGYERQRHRLFRAKAPSTATKSRPQNQGG